jgi:hypothetical protein
MCNNEKHKSVKLLRCWFRINSVNCMFTSCHQIARQNCNVKIAIKAHENVVNFQYSIWKQQ